MPQWGLFGSLKSGEGSALTPEPVSRVNGSGDAAAEAEIHPQALPSTVIPPASLVRRLDAALHKVVQF